MAPTKTPLISHKCPTDPPVKKKRRRGKKSPESQRKHTQKWVEQGIKSNTIIETVHRPPNDVVGTKKSGERIREITEEIFPSYHTLPTYAVPDNAAVQFDTTPKSDKQQNEIIGHWDRLTTLSPTHFLASKDGNRSAIPAYHFGVWQRTAPRALLTRESREQGPETIKALDALAECIKNISLKLAQIMKEDMPNMYARGVACHQYVHSIPHLAKQLKDRPAMDLGPAAFAFAIKEGSSEIAHVDFTDDYSFPNFVVPLGPFTGAEFNCPQLGYRIPIHGGQVLASKARLVIHFSSPHTGRRIAITLFTDSVLLKRAQEKGFI
ncbi:hypothetical protein BDZ89DRAFT_1138561 [Hymenopellis radicata]|nr:hypothetical protein BDZ89DRAFT_1138561 [Hymenopellis radicata]